ncbi:hypothetical protein AB0F93_27830, partial [Micromonospora tulbaghiae]
MLTENMPAWAAETARKRLTAAAEDLDDNRVAGLVLDLAAEAGVVPAWEQVCLPLLGTLRGDSAAEIAVEHALSEGVRVGLDVFGREPDAGRGGLHRTGERDLLAVERDDARVGPVDAG